MFNKLLIVFFIIVEFCLSNDYYTDFDIIVNDNPYPSNIFIHTQQSNFIAILDNFLDPYWFVKSDNIGGLDFKPSFDKISFFDKSNLQWIIADKNMDEIDTLACTSGITDYHDIRILNNGGYILQSYDSLFVDMSEIVDGGTQNTKIKGILRIQEFNFNRELIFDWLAFDYLDIADYTNLNLTNSEFTWMHGNSIEIDYDDNLILSDRRSSQLIKIHRTTGEVLWIFGGPLNSFEIMNDSFNGFSKQHDARRLENGNLLLFDNGNNHVPPTSRVAEYALNEQNMIATLVWDFLNPYGNLSASMGSVQRLPNDNTLINWGNTPSANANIMEVDPNNNIVLELVFDSGSCYKVRKSDWAFNIPMLIGDPNLDGIINILDVLYQINFILSENSENLFNLYKIDLNKDANIDVLDVVEIVNIILN